MRATIKDVAKEAGVSPATVSLVLNKRDAAIAAATRDRVLRAAEKLSYRPNQSAVALSARRTNTIGIIIPDLTNSFHNAFCDRINRYAAQHGYSVLIRIARSGWQDTLTYLYDMEDRALDGIILTKSQFENDEDTKACMELLSHLHTPVMLADRVPAHITRDAVLMNDTLGGRLATEHLVSLGHTRIGCLTASLYYEIAARRLSGYRQVLEEHGIPYDPDLILEAGDWNAAPGSQFLPRFLGRGVTAVFAFNDAMAYEIYREARQYGVRIPDQLSVIGFDNLPYSDVITPPLTSLEYPVDDMAHALVESLMKKIADPSCSTEVATFDPVVMVKSSTAGPCK